jgi:hypothetical protein
MKNPSKSVRAVSSLLLMCSLLLALTSACNTNTPAPAPAGSPERARQVSEAMLKALDAGDYAAFTRDFAPSMKGEVPQTDFNDLRTVIGGTSGKFKAIKDARSTSADNNPGYVIYQITAQFEQESVILTLTFKNGSDKVEGFLLDSENLKKLHPNP